MKESEAIKELKYDYNELGKAIPCDTSWGCSIEKAYGMAIQALEKQIPMKPTEINDECGYFECPACGDLIYAEGARFEEHKYCLSCGQKLDWR